jgi:hypothetical protein
MDDARKETNPNLNEEFRFQWKEFDLYGEISKAQAVQPVMQSLIRISATALDTSELPKKCIPHRPSLRPKPSTDH